MTYLVGSGRRREVIYLSVKMIRLVAVATFLISLSASVAYAVFISNRVAIENNTLTTTVASIKLCDANGQNRWTTSIPASANLLNMAPGEERLLLPDHHIYLASDNGILDTVYGPQKCMSYDQGAMSPSRLPMSVIPVVETTGNDCDSLSQDVTLQISRQDGNSLTKTFAEWKDNGDPLGSPLIPGQPVELVLSARLKESSTVQKAQCLFNVSFTGKQI